MTDAGAIAVVAEHFGGRLRPVAWELLGAARELQRKRGGAIAALVVGADVAELAAELAPFADETIALETPDAPSYSGEVWRDALAAGLADLRAAFVLVAHTTQGLDFSPGLAVRLGAACITGVDGFAWNNGAPLFRRPAHGGKAVALVSSAAPMSILAIEPGAFRRAERSAHGAGPVKKIRIAATRLQTRILEMTRPPAEAADLTAADVIVAAGRGVKKQEDLALIRETAGLFPKAAVAGSRPLCDAGWLPYSRQVGQTGATVAPKLYLACGISGAAQHVVGMRGAGFVVAVNTDPNAAIFNVADVRVVADLAEFLPLFAAACRAEKS